MMDKKNVLVTGTGSLIGQAIIKSLLKSEIRDNIGIIGCDYFDNTVGSFWCERNYVLPDLLNEELIVAWKKAIIDIIEKESIRVLLVGVDFELGYFADMKDEMENNYGCKVIVSDKRVIDIGNDKYDTYLFLKNNGINAPSTTLLDETNEAMIEFPVVIKPRVGARSRGVYFIDNIETYKNILSQCMGKGYIVQKAIGSMTSEYSCGILYWEGKFINSIVLKRVLKEGNTSLADYNNNAETEIIDYIRKIGDVLQPFGSCNLQLRMGEDDMPYLFEINPRFSGTTYMRALFGYNEVDYIVRKSLGMNLQDMNPKSGRAYRYYEERLV